MAKLPIIRTKGLKRSRAVVAQHGTASHYYHNGLEGVKERKKHKWHSMAQLPIIGTKSLRRSRAVVAQHGTASIIITTTGPKH